VLCTELVGTDPVPHTPLVACGLGPVTVNRSVFIQFAFPIIPHGLLDVSMRFHVHVYTVFGRCISPNDFRTVSDYSVENIFSH
jgi:hypothetical protein